MTLVPSSRITRLLARLTLGVAVASLLSACFPLVMGGAVVGTMVATDRRTSGAQLEDEGIELRAASRIRENLGDRVENVNSVVNELAELGNASLTQRSSDVLVTGRVKAGLVDAKDLVSSAFKVVTERGTVYLLGRVTQREADRATEIARSTSGVQKVVRVFETLTEDELRNMLPQPAPAK